MRKSVEILQKSAFAHGGLLPQETPSLSELADVPTMDSIDIKIFAENVEQGALDDINALAGVHINAHKKLRFMPDCHKGVTVPIGTSIPIDIGDPKEAINPGTVGCDIGCTVSATFFDAPMFPEKMAEFEHKIRKQIPFGFAINDKSSFDRREFYKMINRNMNRLVSRHPAFADFAIRINCDSEMVAWCRRIGISETLKTEDFVREMGDAGIYTTTANRDTLDEAPEAYKDKDDIIRLIEPTAKVLFFLKPKMNIKAAESQPSWRK